MFVHVRDEAEGICRAAIVLYPGEPVRGDGRLLRVLYRSPFGAHLGEHDTEGRYHHRDQATEVPNPPQMIEAGGPATRRLDSWHDADDCGYGRVEW
jgi:hypothetical protein